MAYADMSTSRQFFQIVERQSWFFHLFFIFIQHSCRLCPLSSTISWFTMCSYVVITSPKINISATYCLVPNILWLEIKFDLFINDLGLVSISKQFDTRFVWMVTASVTYYNCSSFATQLCSFYKGTKGFLHSKMGRKDFKALLSSIFWCCRFCWALINFYCVFVSKEKRSSFCILVTLWPILDVHKTFLLLNGALFCICCKWTAICMVVVVESVLHIIEPGHYFSANIMTKRAEINSRLQPLI
jgi:hypothetical protein